MTAKRPAGPRGGGKGPQQASGPLHDDQHTLAAWRQPGHSPSIDAQWPNTSTASSSSSNPSQRYSQLMAANRLHANPTPSTSSTSPWRRASIVDTTPASPSSSSSRPSPPPVTGRSRSASKSSVRTTESIGAFSIPGSFTRSASAFHLGSDDDDDDYNDDYDFDEAQPDDVSDGVADASGSIWDIDDSRIESGTPATASKRSSVVRTTEKSSWQSSIDAMGAASSKQADAASPSAPSASASLSSLWSKADSPTLQATFGKQAEQRRLSPSPKFGSKPPAPANTSTTSSRRQALLEVSESWDDDFDFDDDGAARAASSAAHGSPESNRSASPEVDRSGASTSASGRGSRQQKTRQRKRASGSEDEDWDATSWGRSSEGGHHVLGNSRSSRTLRGGASGTRMAPLSSVHPLSPMEGQRGSPERMRRNGGRDAKRSSTDSAATDLSAALAMQSDVSSWRSSVASSLDSDGAAKAMAAPPSPDVARPSLAPMRRSSHHLDSGDETESPAAAIPRRQQPTLDDSPRSHKRRGSASRVAASLANRLPWKKEAQGAGALSITTEREAGGAVSPVPLSASPTQSRASSRASGAPSAWRGFASTAPVKPSHSPTRPITPRLSPGGQREGEEVERSWAAAISSRLTRPSSSRRSSGNLSVSPKEERRASGQQAPAPVPTSTSPQPQLFAAMRARRNSNAQSPPPTLDVPATMSVSPPARQGFFSRSPPAAVLAQSQQQQQQSPPPASPTLEKRKHRPSSSLSLSFGFGTGSSEASRKKASARGTSPVAPTMRQDSSVEAQQDASPSIILQHGTSQPRPPPSSFHNRAASTQALAGPSGSRRASQASSHLNAAGTRSVSTSTTGTESASASDAWTGALSETGTETSDALESDVVPSGAKQSRINWRWPGSAAVSDQAEEQRPDARLSSFGFPAAGPNRKTPAKSISRPERPDRAAARGRPGTATATAMNIDDDEMEASSPESGSKAPVSVHQETTPASRRSVQRDSASPSVAAQAGKQPSAATRRNSLSDLRIPKRISQAQQGIRSNMNHLKDFAKGIEELRAMQAKREKALDHLQADASISTSSALAKADQSFASWWECADVLVGLAKGRSDADDEADVSTVSVVQAERPTLRERRITLDTSSPHLRMQAAPAAGQRDSDSSPASSRHTASSSSISRRSRMIDAQREVDILAAILAGTPPGQTPALPTSVPGAAFSVFDTPSRDPEGSITTRSEMRTPLVRWPGSSSSSIEPSPEHDRQSSGGGQMQSQSQSQAQSAWRWDSSSAARRPSTGSSVAGSINGGSRAPSSAGYHRTAPPGLARAAAAMSTDSLASTESGGPRRRRLKSASRAGIQGLRELLKSLRIASPTSQDTAIFPSTSSSNERRGGEIGFAYKLFGASRTSLNNRTSAEMSRPSSPHGKSTGRTTPGYEDPPSSPSARLSAAGAGSPKATSADSAWSRRSAKAKDAAALPPPTSSSATKAAALAQRSLSDSHNAGAAADAGRAPRDKNGTGSTSGSSIGWASSSAGVSNGSGLSASVSGREAQGSSTAGSASASTAPHPSGLPAPSPADPTASSYRKLAMKPEAIPSLLLYVEATRQHCAEALAALEALVATSRYKPSGGATAVVGGEGVAGLPSPSLGPVVVPRSGAGGRRGSGDAKSSNTSTLAPELGTSPRKRLASVRESRATTATTRGGSPRDLNASLPPLDDLLPTNGKGATTSTPMSEAQAPSSSSFSSYRPNDATVRASRRTASRTIL